MQLLKKSLTSKDFYTTGYKQVSRMKTVSFVFLISLVFALFTSPITSITSYKAFITLKEQVNELSSKVSISYKNSEGLATNVSYPIELKLDKNTLMVIDPKAEYFSKQDNLSEIVLRNKGYLVYKNGELERQVTYSLPEFLEFDISSQELKEEFNSVSDTYILTVFASVNLITNFLSALLNILVMSVMFGSVSFVVNNTLLKRKDTLLQNYKKMFFLSIFLLLGMAANTLFTGQGAIFDILFLAFGYLWLVR